MNFDRRICCSVSDPTNSGRCVVRFPNFGKSILYPKTNKTKTNSPFNSILYYFYPSVCSTDTHKCIYLSTIIYLSIYLYLSTISMYFSLCNLCVCPSKIYRYFCQPGYLSIISQSILCYPSIYLSIYCLSVCAIIGVCVLKRVYLQHLPL